MANYLALPDALNHPLNRSQISSCVPPCSRRLGNLHCLSVVVSIYLFHSFHAL
jgi:hypothetical protein